MQILRDLSRKRSFAVDSRRSCVVKGSVLIPRRCPGFEHCKHQTCSGAANPRGLSHVSALFCCAPCAHVGIVLSDESAPQERCGAGGAELCSLEDLVEEGCTAAGRRSSASSCCSLLCAACVGREVWLLGECGGTLAIGQHGYNITGVWSRLQAFGHYQS